MIRAGIIHPRFANMENRDDDDDTWWLIVIVLCIIIPWMNLVLFGD